MVQATQSTTTPLKPVQTRYARELEEITHALSVFMLPQGERFFDPEREFDEVSENPHWFVPGMIHVLRVHGGKHPAAKAAALVLAEGMNDYYDRCDRDGDLEDEDGDCIMVHYDPSYAERAYQILTDDRVASGLRHWQDSILAAGRSVTQ